MKHKSIPKCAEISFGTDLCKLSKEDIIYKDVVVIGNGPSGICLSYFLSGNWPYYNGVEIPDEMLQARLNSSSKDKSLIEQDLQFLSDGLEGRSSNPVALLFDILTNPTADFGIYSPPALQYRHHLDRAISHVVIGRGAAGGIWQTMERQMKTLSVGSLMQMPDMCFQKWLRKYRRSDTHKHLYERASVDEMCAYFNEFIDTKGLRKNFHNNAVVTSLVRIDARMDDSLQTDDIFGDCGFVDCNDRMLWEVGVRTNSGKNIYYRCKSVVLATGAFDRPKWLGVSGEEESYVLHSHTQFEKALQSLKKTLLRELNSGYDELPVVIIGAGLSAADAVLRARRLGLPVVHIFRRNSFEVEKIYGHLQQHLYPEYHQVHRLMKGELLDDLYTPYAGVQILRFTSDHQAIIRVPTKKPDTYQDVIITASRVVVLIGSNPNFSFLDPSLHKKLAKCPGIGLSNENHINVDPYTYQSWACPGLFALGPLVGDNFVRYLKGGALAVTGKIWRQICGED